MSYTKNIGKNLTLGWDSSGGTSYVVLGTVVDIEGGGTKTKTVPSTLLSDAYSTFLGGEIDPGQVKFSVGYDPGSTEYAALALAQKNKTSAGWQLSLLSGGNEAWKGIIVELDRKLGADKFDVVDIVVQNVGDPGLGGN